MRIATLYDPELPNSYYRCVIPLRALAAHGHEIVWPGPTNPVERLLTCDVVHLHRQYGPRTARAIPRLASAGVAVSYDNDDDLSAIPRASPAYARWRRDGARAFQATIDAARRATLVTTPSGALAERYRAAGARHVIEIENYLPREFIDQRRRRHHGLVIGWIAGLTHVADAEPLAIGATLERLLGVYADLRVATIGLDLKLRSDRYHNLERVPFAQLAHAAAAFDIGIAPLADIPFNAARSNVKVKEYAGLGIPWLASPVGPYRGLGPAQGGMLVEDREWDPALTRLIEDRGLRRRLGRAARQWGRSQAIDRHVGRWEQAFSAAVQRAKAPRRRTAGA